RAIGQRLRGTTTRRWRSKAPPGRLRKPLKKVCSKAFKNRKRKRKDTRVSMKQAILAGAIALVSITSLLAQKQPQPKSKKEVDGINAMITAKTPDERIEKAQFLLTKFADTEFKAIAMQMTAEAYEMKNDNEKMQAWCEKTIEVDPKNFSCMLMI